MPDQTPRTSLHWLRPRRGPARSGFAEPRHGVPPGGADQRWRRTVRQRVIVAAALFGLWTAGIQARLVYLQVVDRADLTARAERQQQRTMELPAERGEIVDRHGRVLAYSVDADSIYAVPAEIGDAARAADRLCGAFGDCTPAERQTLVERFGSQRAFSYVRRQVSPDVAARVEALDLPGIGFLKESRRYYPKKDLAASLLGFVGVDNVGLAGIEATYDSQIRGHGGRMLIQTDARQHALFSRVDPAPTAGADLELTIDEYIQYIAERELRAGVEENEATGGSIVVMDPASGQILAVANWPTFNPNVFQRATAEARRNRAIQDLYEPGSTFKIVTASAAIQEHVVQPDDPIDVSAGMIRFGSRQIDDDHRYGVLTFTDVIVKSSNVGTIKVGLKLGADRLDRYARRFGFGETLSPDFRGESPGIVWSPAHLDDTALASMCMGYQVAVTPLQMAAAASAVANGGELVEPRVVRAVIRDGRRVEMPRTVLDRAITPETAGTLTTIMEQVVDHGTGTRAQVPGYHVAGKTGTSHKLVDGHYSNTQYNASFVGFVPSRRPALTIVVVIDSPHKNGYYAATVAAPIFARVAEAALRHLGIPPTINPLPPVLVARASAPDVPVPQPVRMPAVLSRVAGPVGGRGLMPDLRGLSAREALRALAELGLGVRLLGDGLVADQEPAPGTPLDRGGSATLHLERRTAGGVGQ